MLINHILCLLAHFLSLQLLKQFVMFFLKNMVSLSLFDEINAEGGQLLDEGLEHGDLLFTQDGEGERSNCVELE